MFFANVKVLSRGVPLSACGALEGVLLFADSPGQLFAGRHPKGRSALEPFSHHPQIAMASRSRSPAALVCKMCRLLVHPRISSTEIAVTSTGSVDKTDTPPVVMVRVELRPRRIVDSSND